MKNTKNPSSLLGLLRATYIIAFMTISIGAIVTGGLVLSLKIIPEVLLWTFPSAGYVPAIAVSCMLFTPAIFGVILYFIQAILDAGLESMRK